MSPAPGSIFVDLGSGCGKALFAAALSCPQLGECRGVEILPALAEQSLEVLRRYEVLSAKVAGSCGLRLPPVTLEVGNMYYSNAWAGADLVYCFATMLGPRSLQLLQMRVEDMRPGAQALIVSKRLSSPLLQEEAVFYLSMAQNGEDMPCFLCKRV